MAKESRVAVIVVAGGSGKRMGHSLPKQFLRLKDIPIFILCLIPFESCDLIDEVILVAPAEHLEEMRRLIRTFGLLKIVRIVPGGQRRQDSVSNGLKAVSAGTDILLIHDGVRPFITQDQISRVIKKVRQTGAAILAIPATDTIKRTADGIILETLDRRSLWHAQTPQGFRKALLVDAYIDADRSGIIATDDASLVERLGHSVHIVEGSADNIKITEPGDLEIAMTILEKGRCG